MHTHIDTHFLGESSQCRPPSTSRKEFKLIFSKPLQSFSVAKQKSTHTHTHIKSQDFTSARQVDLRAALHHINLMFNVAAHVRENEQCTVRISVIRNFMAAYWKYSYSFRKEDISNDYTESRTAC